MATLHDRLGSYYVCVCIYIYLILPANKFLWVRTIFELTLPLSFLMPPFIPVPPPLPLGDNRKCLIAVCLVHWCTCGVATAPGLTFVCPCVCVFPSSLQPTTVADSRGGRDGETPLFMCTGPTGSVLS